MIFFQSIIKTPIIIFFVNLDVCEELRINDVIQKLTHDLSKIEQQTQILNATGSKGHGLNQYYIVIQKTIPKLVINNESFANTSY